MHSLNLFCLTLIYLTKSSALKIEEVLFPIRNFSSSVTKFVNEYSYDRPQFDIERVPFWDLDTEQEQNRRLLARVKKYHNATKLAPWNPENNYHKRPSLSESIEYIVSQYDFYEIEEHTVETADGYILTLHRIVREDQPSNWTGKGVVYIQHGLLLSSDAYVLQGSKKDLAYILTENNYDVWLGNARGNAYSRSHSILTTNESEFWDFSFHDVGVQDLRYSIDYVLNRTKSSYLNFIGYSIGATESYVLLSEYPEYNDKIRLLISISPLLFWKRPENQSSQINEIIEKIENLQGNSDEGNGDGARTGELYPLSSYMEFFAYYRQWSCKEIFSTFFGDLNTKIDDGTCIFLSRHMPAGSSVKTLLHLLQLIQSGRFQKFDDGSGWNIEEYDLSKITAPHAIFVGPDEKFLYEKDINELQNRFPNSVMYKVKHPNGAYMDDLGFPFSFAAKHIATAIKDLLPLV